MENFEKRLYEIHSQLDFDKRTLLQEIPEQLMILKHIRPEHSVLELGGSVGKKLIFIFI